MSETEANTNLANSSSIIYAPTNESNNHVAATDEDGVEGDMELDIPIYAPANKSNNHVASTDDAGGEGGVDPLDQLDDWLNSYLDGDHQVQGDPSGLNENWADQFSNQPPNKDPPGKGHTC